MSSVKQSYRDISPVTLQVVGGAVSSSLYCDEVEGLSGEVGGLVESFLVELYRCKLCQFTCGIKSIISSHLLHRHRPPALSYLGDADEGVGAEGVDELGHQQGASPYQLDLNSQSKQSDEDEDFLLYNMLDNMSPPTCDISTEGGLQVAQTCEVSTLFEEDERNVGEEEGAEPIFPLQEGSVDLTCPINPPVSKEEMAQSAHLMTLGLCRISAARPPPPLPDPTHSSQADRKRSRIDGRKANALLSCSICPITLSSRRLLDVHIQSHRASGGFRCVRCSWNAHSWEEFEPHWRKQCWRKRRRRGEEEKEREKEVGLFRCLRTFKNVASQNAHRHGNCSDSCKNMLIGQAGVKKAELMDSQMETSLCAPVPGPMSRLQSRSLRSATNRKRKKTHRKKNIKKEIENGTDETGFCCSLCHRKFSSKLTLRRHLSVHTGERPFTCPHCEYSSRLKGSLQQHLRTHTGEKPHRCAQCSYASIDRSSLIRHSRTHSQEKPHRCTHCDYSSIQKKSLDLHARRHHTGEAFPCPECEYSSPDRQLLLRHVRRHHAPSQHVAR